MEINKEERGCVYFFRHIGLSPVKIGFSTNESPLERFNQFKTYAPFGSEILGFIQTDEPKKLETLLHQKFSSYRINGEWFEINEEKVKYEIDFYSKIEDVKERNDFQINYAKFISEKKDFNKTIKENIKLYDEIKSINKKEYFNSIFKADPKLNRTKIADKLNVSRHTILNWIKEINI